MTQVRHLLNRGLLAAAVLLAAAGCQRVPGSGAAGGHRQLEFVVVAGQPEGLLFTLPRGFKIQPGEQRFQGAFVKSYRPASDRGELPSQALSAIVRPLSAMPPRVASLPPDRLVLAMAMSLRQRVCPSSFTASPIGPLAGVVQPSFAAVAACGQTPRGGSEATLIVAVHGRGDLFQLTWMERGPASQGAPRIDLPRWKQRLQGLGPLRLCAPVAAGGPDPACSIDVISSHS